MPENLHSPYHEIHEVDGALKGAAPSASGQGITRTEIEVETDHGVFDAYMTAVESGRGPGVLMVSTIFGLNQVLKDWSDELAIHGCVVIAPNLFSRDPEDRGVLALPHDTERAVARAMRLDFAKSMGDLRYAIATLKNHPNCNGKVVLLGFCLGGPYAWRAACDGLDIEAAVSFHGSFVSRYLKPDDKPACRVVFHYGDSDDLAPPPELAAVKAASDASGSEFIVYQGARHAFMVKADRQNYNPGAAMQSWGHTMNIIGKLF